MRRYKIVKEKKITFDMTEWEQVEKRAASVRLKTGTFIKRIAVSGKINYIDLEKAAPLYNALRSISNNINQIARIANEINSIYRSDIENLRKEYNDICLMLNQFLYTLQSIGA